MVPGLKCRASLLLHKKNHHKPVRGQKGNAMERLSDNCIRFLHLADLHFGTEAHGKLDPQSGLNSRLLDFSRSLEKVLDQAFKMDIDAVLFAGDAYRNNRPNPTEQRELARHVARISQEGIPLVMLVGNHDQSPGRGHAGATDVFGTLCMPNVWVVDQAQTLRIPTRRGPLDIVCIPYPTRHNLLTEDDLWRLDSSAQEVAITEAIGRILRDAIDAKDASVPLVALAHIAISEAKLSGSERNMTIADELTMPRSSLCLEGIEYFAMGHIHRFQDLSPDGCPPVVYPGTLERIDFGEEKDRKGFVIVDVEPGRARYQFFPTRAREFVTVAVDLTGKTDPTEALKKEVEKYSLKDAIVRLQCTATEQQQTDIDLGQLDDLLKDAHANAGLTVHSPEPDPVRTRSSLTETSTVKEALDEYLKQKNIEPEICQEIMQKAESLEHKLNNR